MSLPVSPVQNKCSIVHSDTMKLHKDSPLQLENLPRNCSSAPHRRHPSPWACFWTLWSRRSPATAKPRRGERKKMLQGRGSPGIWKWLKSSFAMLSGLWNYYNWDSLFMNKLCLSQSLNIFLLGGMCCSCYNLGLILFWLWQNILNVTWMGWEQWLCSSFSCSDLRVKSEPNIVFLSKNMTQNE